MQRNETRSLNSFSRYGFLGAILFILLIAAGLRLWKLPDIPPGPHYDEAANGILAAEIARGEKTPVFIPSYTGKETLFFYTAAALMRLIGVGLSALRLTVALIGVITVVASAWLAYELFADENGAASAWLAMLTGVLIATSFWHVVLSRVGFRAVTQPLFQALTLATLWRGLRRDSLRWILLGGLCFGLTGHTYLAARAFPVPLVIVWVALLLLDPQRRRNRLRQLSCFGLTALISFAPLGLYFVRHPDAFTNRIGQVGPGDDLYAALTGITAAFKMIFLQGDPYIRFNLPFRPLFGPVIAVFLVLGLAVTVWRLLHPGPTRHSNALQRAREIMLVVWIPIMILPTALAVREITPNNLRAVGLIPLLFVFPARGFWALVQWSSRRYRIPQHWFLLVVFLLLLATTWRTADDYFYSYAPRTDLYEASDGDLADIATYLDQTDLTNMTVYVGSIHYRHPTLAFLAESYPQIKWLVGASTVVYPPSGKALYLFPRSAMPEPQWLARNLPGAEPLAPVTASDGAPAFTGYRVDSAIHLSDEGLADFGGVVRLLQYAVDRAKSGDGLDVTIVWQVLSIPPYPGLTPFYHLEDLRGFRWGQAEPFQYAAEDWTPGETIVDRVHIPIALGAPPGEYVLKAGLYSQNADKRLAVIDKADRIVGTTASLAVTVNRAEVTPNPDVLGIRHRLDLEIADGLTLLGVNLDTIQARPGEQLYLTLFWQTGPSFVVSPSNEPLDFSVELSLQNTARDQIMLYNGAPIDDTYPMRHWTANEIVVDRYNPRLPLATADAPPGDYTLVLTLTSPDGEKSIGPTMLGAMTLVPTDRSFAVPAMQHTQRVTLGEQVELLGYDIDLGDAEPGGTIHLFLYWRALTEMSVNYSVFTHLLDTSGQIAAQQDNPPVNGTYITTLWLPGEIVADPYSIALPADLPPGDYPIEIGFYLPENGLRLADPVRLDTIVTIRP